MILNKLWVFKGFLLLIVFSTVLKGETILFKDGTILKGKVSSQNAYNLTVKTEDGKSQEISKIRILKIVYKDNVSQEEALRIKKEEEAKLAEREKEDLELTKKAKQELLEKERKSIETKKKEEERLVRLQKLRLSSWDVTWRSAVFPGWGQWIDERKTSAFVYSALFIGSFYLAYRERQIYQNSVKDLNHMNNPYETWIPVPSFSDPVALFLYNKPFEDQRKNVNQNYHNFQLSAALTVLIYVANVFDAYFFHPRFTNFAVSNLILDYNPMTRLDSYSASSGSTSTESSLKFGLRFHLE
ncbi:LA_0442/LA_0875 N-terminal domain-containing protein [Leptospira alstonii]|nr:DUF5683 domain-containing protein [Leptospira alstonii]